MQHRRLTRAGLAAETGISKPTVGESVRRLTEAGLVADTGERTLGGRGRGRVGSYYALAGVGVALALSIAPEGIVAECVDALGDTVSRAEQDIGRPARPDQVAAALRAAVIRAHQGTGGTPRLAVVSAADPVDRGTGRLIQLPDAPFLLGELDPVRGSRPVRRRTGHRGQRRELGRQGRTGRRAPGGPARFRLRLPRRRRGLRDRERRRGQARLQRSRRRGRSPHYRWPAGSGHAPHRRFRRARPQASPARRRSTPAA